MNREKLEKTFQRLIDEGKTGFTIDIDGYLFEPSFGFAVSSETYSTLEEAIDSITPHQYLGWWIDLDTGKTYIEVVDYFQNGNTAYLAASHRNQKAIYNFGTSSIVYLQNNN